MAAALDTIIVAVPATWDVAGGAGAIPTVRNTADLLAVVAFASPTLSLENDLVALFDAIAESFAFT